MGGVVIIEFYMLKYFMTFVVFFEVFTSFFIVKSILYAYKRKHISFKKVIAFLSIICVIIFVTLIVFIVIIVQKG